ncbi:MAG: hypothetical protein ACRDSZ_01165 [Pseudonocardiaceae bacterium]
MSNQGERVWRELCAVAARQPGRHRQARLGWWPRRKAPAFALDAVTVQELLRRRDRDHRYARRTRRVLVMPRPHQPAGSQPLRRPATSPTS